MAAAFEIQPEVNAAGDIRFELFEVAGETNDAEQAHENGGYNHDAFNLQVPLHRKFLPLNLK
jgi:hypothetical protein